MTHDEVLWPEWKQNRLFNNRLSVKLLLGLTFNKLVSTNSSVGVHENTKNANDQK